MDFSPISSLLQQSYYFWWFISTSTLHIFQVKFKLLMLPTADYSKYYAEPGGSTQSLRNQDGRI